jgi:uncharacterized protein (DUF1501 family)
MSHHDTSNARRRFLAQSARIALGSAAAYATLGRLQMVQAASVQPPEDYRALVCIYLFGGADSFNMVVPRTASAYADYQAARPALSVTQANLLPISPLSGDGGISWGLHPAMTEMQQLFEAGHAGLLANVGPLVAPTTKAAYQARSVPLPPELFSHVDQQAYSMSMGSETAARAGWGGQIADRLADSGLLVGSGLPTSISMSGTNMWQGGASDGIYTMGSGGPSRINDTLRPGNTWTRTIPRREAFYKLLDAAKRDPSLFTREYARISQRALDFSEFAYQSLADAPPITTPFPVAGQNRLADTLMTVARTISARHALGQRRQIFFVGLGGWDTHDNMLPDHERLLRTLSQASAAFYNATVELGVSDKVTTFTMTDFGRTLNNNGDGTDHGWGGHSWVVGGDVVGRRIYGQMPEMRLGSDQDVGRGRMIPTTAIEQLGSTLSRWFGLRYGDAMEIFPNLRNFGTGADYIPMLASSNHLLNEIDFERKLGG